MIIHEAEPYTNRDGITEKPYQYYYFQEYHKLPPNIRTVPNLHKILTKLDNEGRLPVRLYKEETIRGYKSRFDWDERILREAGTRNQKTQIQNTDYLYNELWKDVIDYHQKTRKQKKKIAWEEVDTNNPTQVRNMTEIQKTYDQSFKTLQGSPVSLAEMYAMMEVLSQATQDDEDRLSVLKSLLDDDEEPDEDED